MAAFIYCALRYIVFVTWHAMKLLWQQNLRIIHIKHWREVRWPIKRIYFVRDYFDECERDQHVSFRRNVRLSNGETKFQEITWLHFNYLPMQNQLAYLYTLSMNLYLYLIRFVQTKSCAYMDGYLDVLRTVLCGVCTVHAVRCTYVCVWIYRFDVSI